MNIRDLEYLVAVADLQHFGLASEKCCVSQPTLSSQIKKLETELGIKVFERANRRVIITDIGKNVLASARRILHEVNNIKEEAAAAHTPLGGRLRLGAFPTLASYVFPDLVSKISSSPLQPKLILVEEKTAALVLKLKAGELDVALLALPIQDQFLQSQKVFEDPFYLAVPVHHELASLKEVDQASLSQYPLLLLDEGHCLRDQALALCQMHNIAEEQDFRATSLETLRQMVKAGTGITLMPKIAISEQDEGIKYIPFSSPVPTRTIALVWRKTFTRNALLASLLELMVR